MFRFVLRCCTIAAISQTCFAQEISVAPLTDDQKAAIQTIEQSEVLSTVSFLASDEMAGRDTPSPELDIAAAYVAARFKGAGLDGLGPDGSYYQTTELTQYLQPRTEATITRDGMPVECRGVLFGGEKQTTVTAKISDGKDLNDVAGKIVVIDDSPLPPQAVDNPGMLVATWSRRVAQIANKGAAAVLVRVADDSILPEAAGRLREKPLTFPAQFLTPCPVILIRSDADMTGEIHVEAPARETVETPVKNVIGVLRGSDTELANEAIIISAHLDHIGRLQGDRGGDTINNGADDNATGVTAVVSLADAYSSLKQRPKRSVIFMTFWGEEDGLLGSKYYAENPLWPLEKTVANINFEMIGRPEENAEGKAWGTGWTRSNLGDQMAAGAARADVTIFYREDVSEMLYTRSDNYAFVQKGVIAHSFSAGSLHSDYHQPTDEVSRLNIPHMTRIIQGLFAGSLPIADGELTPSKTNP
jgi:hypothetical protein